MRLNSLVGGAVDQYDPFMVLGTCFYSGCIGVPTMAQDRFLLVDAVKQVAGLGVLEEAHQSYICEFS